MLKTIDQALAGAIDIIADDVQATVKSVREQGVMRTLGDAVEDAAGLVKTGASTVMQGVVGSKKGPEKISNHAGVSSSYADLCAGPGSRSMTSGGAVFPFVPSPHLPKATATNTALSRSSWVKSTGAVPTFATASSSQGSAVLGLGHVRTEESTGASVAGVKDPPLPAGVLAGRFEEVKKRDIANEKCFDCGAANPEWASVSFGVFLCIECAGHHREMGTHISRIRSCKMDSWTERQLQIFNHSGNRHVAEFFSANSVSSTERYQRYQTRAAEWFREAWIKNRIFDRPVPAPPQGVVAGPCVDGVAVAKETAASRRTGKAEMATPPEDLLDLGGNTSTAVAQPTHADLLGFDDSTTVPAVSISASPAAHVDLLSTVSSTPLMTAAAESASGDLLGLSTSGSSAKGAAASRGTASAALDLADLMPQPAAAPQNTVVPAALPQHGVVPAPVPQNATAEVVPKGGKASDPFALALEMWQM